VKEPQTTRTSGQRFPHSERSAEIPTAQRPPTEAAPDGGSGASVPSAPTASPVTCCPSSPWELTSQDEGLPCPTPRVEEGKTRQRKQKGRGEATGEASCSHRLPPQRSLHPDQLMARERECTQPPAAYDAPTDTAQQQANKDPGGQADNWREFNSISP